MTTRTRWPQRFSLVVAALIVAAVPGGAMASAAAPEAARTSVIVRATESGAARAAVEAAGGRVTRDLWIVDGVAAEVPVAALGALRAQPGIIDVGTDDPVQVQANPSPLHAASAVYPRVVGADRLWSEGVDGEGVTVAVVDTGIAPVPDLAGRVIGGIDDLEALGVKLAIDDFGTGYSALSRLRGFPFHTLKIDRSFISEIEAPSDEAPIVAAMIAMAHAMKLEVVAEGVETSTQRDYLDRQGCDIGQGYLFSRPVEATRIEEMVAPVAA